MPHRKWDSAAGSYDIFNRGIERRYGDYKKELFAKASGKTLLVAAGTGLDFDCFPPGIEITAVDFSPKMLEKAKKRAERFNGRIKVVLADIQQTDFPDESFDTAVTSCTFCSVPDPVKGLREIHRILKPDGRLLMFEHVRPSHPLLGVMMDILNPVVSAFGPNINRQTAENVRKAGFRIVREYNVYLDMVKTFEAQKA